MFKKLKDALHSAAMAKGYKKAFAGGHLVYFGAVAVEAHGFYAMAGGFLLVLILVGYVLHLDAEE